MTASELPRPRPAVPSHGGGKELRRGSVDKELDVQLKREGSGILRWLIDGCLEWQRIGLNPPPVVLAATAEYLAEEDAVSQWLTDCCVRSGWGSSASLFASWRAWAEARGEHVGTSKWLTRSLIQKGFQKEDFRTERGLRGLHIRPAPSWDRDR